MATRNDRVPNGIYNVRVKETTYGPSQKSEPMITAKCEIVSPEMKDFGGDQYAVAGKEFTSWFSFSPKAVVRTTQTLAKLGITLQDGESLEAFGQRAANELRNVTFNTLVSGEAIIAREDLTPEQIAEGKKPWDANPIIGPDGQPVVSGFKVTATINDKTIYPPVSRL